jgi:hypothetical protein
MKRTQRFLVLVVLVVAFAVPACAASPETIATATRTGDVGTLYMIGSLQSPTDPLVLWASDYSYELREAVAIGDLTAITRLVDAGADARTVLGEERFLSPRVLAALAGTPARTAVPLAGVAGDTPLMAAARCGNCDAIIALLAAGADTGERHPYTGQTASTIAAASGHHDAAVMLAVVALGR